MFEVAIGEKFSEHTPGRGKKKCPDCNSYGPAVSRKCNVCHYEFYTTQKKGMKSLTKYGKLIKDWTILKKGDKIYVQSNDHFNSKSNEIHHIGYNQEFVVQSVDEGGIVVYSPKLGWAYIDMVFYGTSKAGIKRDLPKVYVK